MMESHMTFIIGEVSVVDLVIVFAMSVVVEWMSHTTFTTNFSDDNRFRAALIQTGLYAVRMAVAYVVMLAVMSFNAGILSAAVAGYTLGFLLFGSRIFDDDEQQYAFGYHKPLDLPPLNC